MSHTGKTSENLKLDAQRTKDVAYDLTAAFVWRETPQGQEYWRQVFLNLESVAAQLIELSER